MLRQHWPMLGMGRDSIHAEPIHAPLVGAIHAEPIHASQGPSQGVWGQYTLYLYMLHRGHHRWTQYTLNQSTLHGRCPFRGSNTEQICQCRLPSTLANVVPILANVGDGVGGGSMHAEPLHAPQVGAMHAEPIHASQEPSQEGWAIHAEPTHASQGSHRWVQYSLNRYTIHKGCPISSNIRSQSTMLITVPSVLNIGQHWPMLRQHWPMLKPRFVP